MVRLERWPRVVPFPGTHAVRLSSCSTPLAAAPEQLLLHVPLPVALSLRRHGSFITIAALTVN
jgi:hypothetical protein